VVVQLISLALLLSFHIYLMGMGAERVMATIPPVVLPFHFTYLCLPGIQGGLLLSFFNFYFNFLPPTTNIYK